MDPLPPPPLDPRMKGVYNAFLRLINICFHSNTGPDPLKNHKATKLAFNVGPSSVRQRNAI